MRKANWYQPMAEMLSTKRTRRSVRHAGPADSGVLQAYCSVAASVAASSAPLILVRDSPLVAATPSPVLVVLSRAFVPGLSQLLSFREGRSGDEGFFSLPPFFLLFLPGSSCAAASSSAAALALPPSPTPPTPFPFPARSELASSLLPFHAFPSAFAERTLSGHGARAGAGTGLTAAGGHLGKISHSSRRQLQLLRRRCDAAWDIARRPSRW